MKKGLSLLSSSFIKAIRLFNRGSYDKRKKFTIVKGNCLEQGDRFTIIPDTVKEIGYGVFRGCRGLKRIVIPNSVTKIGTYAFYGCSNLKSIIIPESVAEIGYYAFLGCSSLKHNCCCR